MPRILLFVFSVLILQSCIPLRIAPKIEDHKLTRGKKFKKSLSKRQMFIFEDPKEAGQFYNFVNLSFNLEDKNVYDDVPFIIEGQQYFFAFYEVEIPDKTLNLGPLLVDLALNLALDNEEPELYVTDESRDLVRRENWYVAIEVYNDSEKDCLSSEALSKELVLNYLSVLRKEYLATNNYNELVFKN